MINELKIKLIEEKLMFIRFCWEQYMKFYTVFLTANIVGVALVVEHVASRSGRLPIALVFIVQNTLAAVTPLKLKALSKSANDELARALEGEGNKSLSAFVSKIEALPVHFADWVGMANSIAQFGLALLWLLLVLFA